MNASLILFILFIPVKFSVFKLRSVWLRQRAALGLLRVFAFKNFQTRWNSDATRLILPNLPV